MTEKSIPFIFDIPQDEKSTFDQLIKKYRSENIRSSKEIVDLVFDENKIFIESIKQGRVSYSISALREIGWKEFLKDEIKFNARLMRDLYKILKTPDNILNSLLTTDVLEKKDSDLILSIKELCGEYAGLAFPYLYALSLSNTQSRRSRAGNTFEAIIYKIYEILDYPYDSQSKVGRKTFSDLGLGKKVDSILPDVSCFSRRRNKTIIGTMKTTLRERWQEVAEEIERTKIPEIHLLTLDEDISINKAKEMANHNIIIVAYDWVANSKELKDLKNIISFEKYLFEEIPTILKFWENNEEEN